MLIPPAVLFSVNFATDFWLPIFVLWFPVVCSHFSVRSIYKQPFILVQIVLPTIPGLFYKFAAECLLIVLSENVSCKPAVIPQISTKLDHWLDTRVKGYYIWLINYY